MTLLKRSLLYLRTVRHIPPSQLLHRLRRMARGRLRRLTRRRAPTALRWTLGGCRPLHAGLDEIGPQDADRPEVADALLGARELTAGRFRFLGQTVPFRDGRIWSDSNFSRLWRFHLHYFDYLKPLFLWKAVENHPSAGRAFKLLVESWIDSNQLLRGDGWHPYTISLRLVNWLKALEFFAEEVRADERFRARFQASVSSQFEVLRGDLELDVRGNHLIKNLRALIWAAICLRPVEKGLLDGWLRLLQSEVEEQVLEDGGHFERTPGYHLVVLEDLLEIGLFLRRNNGASPVWLEDAVAKMARFAIQLLGPGDRIPLLKDTAWDASPNPTGLLAAAALFLDDPSLRRDRELTLYPLLLFGAEGRRQSKEWLGDGRPATEPYLPFSGYFVLRREAYGDYLVFDVGRPCPDYLPAHAHADMFSYELVADGQPWVVDSGVFAYERGDWRDYFRSTRAHNTVSIAGRDQSEVWNSFRVARRAEPGGIIWNESEGHALIQAQHDGYRRLVQRASHRRTLLWLKELGCWLFVDWLSGRGVARAESYLHFHPECDLHQLDARAWRVRAGSKSVWLSVFGVSEFDLVRGQEKPFLQGWYSESFGRLASGECLTLVQTGPLPICFGYLIGKRRMDLAEPSVSDNGEIRIREAEDRFQLRLAVDSPPELR